MLSVYTEHTGPRLDYVLRFIFDEVFEVPYRIISNPEEFKSLEGPKISYSHEGNSDGNRGSFHIPDGGLLGKSGIGEPDTGYSESGGIPVLFPGKGDMGFDVFSAVFYMLSRYEEYLTFKADKYGRFEAAESLAGRKGFLERPVVDIWMAALREGLMKKFRGINLKAPGFIFLPTCDIDIPFAYTQRGKIRTWAGTARSVLRSEPDRYLRRQVLRGKEKDPFDTFTEIEAIHATYELRPVFFFLASAYGKYDKSISPRSGVFRELVKNSMKYAETGLHPSFRSSYNETALFKELSILERITGGEVRNSRQHYLRFSLPGSYRTYIKAGIRQDFSMGFASAAGFRAGTARSFLFYDLEKEEQTGLRIIPFQVMDRTLKDYMGLKPEKALEKARGLIREVKKYGGTFISLWHNDAFSDHAEWKGWKNVYIKMVQEALS